MIDQLNADYLFSLIHTEGITALGSIAQSILCFVHDANVVELESQVAKEIVSNARRFGRGAALLGPFGYFHPSEIISVIADNASRGRLSKNDNGCLYTYDFYPNGEIAIIAFPRNATKTICEHTSNVKAYLTYENLGDSSNEIIDIALAKYDDDGLVETMIQVSLCDNAEKIGHINVEMYSSFEANQRICHLFSIISSDDSFKIYDCFKNSYEVIYDDKMKIVDYECLTDGGRSQITI